MCARLAVCNGGHAHPLPKCGKPSSKSFVYANFASFSKISTGEQPQIVNNQQISSLSQHKIRMAAQSAFEPDPALIRKYSKNGRLELSTGFFQRLFEAGLDQPLRETPILQLNRVSYKSREQFSLRAKLADGLFDYAACFFDKKLIAQNDRDQLAERIQKANGHWIGGEIIAVTRGMWSSDIMLSENRYGFIIESYDLLARNLPELMPATMSEYKHHDGNVASFANVKSPSTVSIPWGEAAVASTAAHGDQAQEQQPPPAKRAKPLEERQQNSRMVVPPTSSSGSGPSAFGSVIPIRGLSPYVTKWKIHGLCTNREEVKNIRSKAGKDLRIFNFEIADRDGDKIRVTAFDGEADRADKQIQEGQTYLISNGNIRSANKQYNTTGCDYEITLNRNSEITPSYSEQIARPKFQLRICPLREVPAHNGENVDVLVVVTHVGEIQDFVSRANKSLTKRELVCVDKSLTQITVTLWGDIARNFDPEAKGQVVGIKGATVKEFNGGYSLNTSFGTQIVLTPSLPEVAELCEWKEAEMGDSTFQTITAQIGIGQMGKENRSVKIAQLLRIGESTVNGAYLTVAADVIRIKPEMALYKACPSGDCKKKVVEMDGCYRCEKCGTTSAHFKWLYMLQCELSDGTGLMYTTAFSPAADQIVGMTPEELGRIKDDDNEHYLEMLNNCYLKPLTFRIRAKPEIYNDENRIRYSIIRVEKRNADDYSQMLQKAIAKLDTMMM